MVLKMIAQEDTVTVDSAGESIVVSFVALQVSQYPSVCLREW